MADARFLNPAHEAPAAAQLPAIDTWFGTFTYDPAKIVTLPQGPVGYTEHNRFIFLDVPGAESGWFKIFQCLDDPKLAFITIPAAAVGHPIDDDDLQNAAHTCGITLESLATVLIVAVPKDGSGTGQKTVNTRAPILIDVANQEGHQVVLSNTKYAVQMPLS